MKLRDLLDILDTDSVRIYCGYTMKVEVGDPYIEMGCKEYMDREVEWIRPLNDAVEITIKETQSEKYVNSGFRNENTVREFTSRMWYLQKIAVIKREDFDEYKDIDDIRKAALMVGKNYQLRSVNYDKVNNMTVHSYGVIDDTLIIEVHG